MTDQDWQTLRTVRLRALEQNPEAFGSTLERERDRPEEYWRGRIATGAWFIARDGSHPVGLAATVASPTGQLLVSMWVDPTRRGRGVGDALVAAVLARARAEGAGTVSLTVGEDNAAARALYLRAGFRPTGEREPHPRDPGRWHEHLRARLLPDGIEISTDPARLDAALVHRWLSEDAYWALGRSREKQDRAIAGSLNFGAYDAASGAQLGYARVVTDLATFAWLCDVYVARTARGRGLGTALATAVRDHLAPYELRRVLLSTGDAHQVYARVGFEPLAEPGKWMMLDGTR
ncbi:ribosomal protein S18 acetylase RimI-like enzyme [Kitasatospora gansuensis]|uniref:Ribosomal protein S18 acetylase RimI-like enzyme n=1 Tax=Kitasatospora gansuensis TaxID=258050 RepID=A0A7W7WFB1_9ACTN|nr:ribosomal protein S18 acetylase RimI-like enzyme [Kitasatospora gansuensis]